MVSSNSACRLSDQKGIPLFCIVAFPAPTSLARGAGQKRQAQETRPAFRPSVQKGRLLERAVDNRCWVQAQPLVEDRRVDAAEVHVGVEVALDQVLSLKGWHLTVMSALDLLAEHKGDPTGAVVSTRAVVLNATAELGEQQHNDVIGFVVLAQIGHK